MFALSGEGKATPTMLGLLGRAILNHGTTHVSINFVACRLLRVLGPIIEVSCF
jgi:hypothetical protein